MSINQSTYRTEVAPARFDALDGAKSLLFHQRGLEVERFDAPHTCTRLAVIHLPEAAGTVHTRYGDGFGRWRPASSTIHDLDKPIIPFQPLDLMRNIERTCTVTWRLEKPHWTTRRP